MSQSHAFQPVQIRSAVTSDGPALGRLGGDLARQHHAFDPPRFMLPDNVDAGYQWWLEKESKNKDAVVLVAAQGGQVVGYAYGRMEERDWNALRDACGALHDVWVEPALRGQRIGQQLVEEMIRRLLKLGAPRVVLMSAAKNEGAQKLFARLGFRPTMVEMTREITER